MRTYEPAAPHPAIGLGQLASRLSETARLTRIDLDEWNVGCAERAFDGAMIGLGRFEHDTVPGGEPRRQAEAWKG